MDTFYIYVLASRHHKHISVGVAADLQYEVRNHRVLISRKLKRRKVWQKLVYVEAVRGVDEAVARERQIDRFPRRQLELLIESVNPGWDSISLSALCESGYGNLLQMSDRH
jgi:putative endonuclease